MTCSVVEDAGDFVASAVVTSNPPCTVSDASGAEIILSGKSYYFEALDLVVTLKAPAGDLKFQGTPDTRTFRVSLDAASEDTGAATNDGSPLGLLPGASPNSPSTVTIDWELTNPGDGPDGVDTLPGRTFQLDVQ